MRSRTQDKDKIMDDIIYVVKLVMLLLSGVLYFSYFLKRRNSSLITSNSIFEVPNLGVALVIFFMIYCIWAIIYSSKNKYKNKTVVQVIENLFFTTVITTLMIISKNSILQYKYLYIFVILVSTLEIGMKFGIVISVTSSMIILFLDLFFSPNLVINQLFQNDLIIVGVFVLVALPLGYYVEIEKEKLKENNDKLNELSNEVKEENIRRKKFERSLLKNQACYNLLIEHGKDAILVHRNNSIIFTNSSAVEFLGFKEKNDLIDKSILEFQIDEEKENFLEVFKDLYDGATLEVVEKGKVLKNNGEEINVESTSVFFTYDGEPTILTILRDITYEKEVEKLQDDVEENIKLLNASREYTNMIIEFIANISHELKTPLNLIYSSIQLMETFEKNECESLDLKDKTQKESRMKYLNIIKQNSLRLIRLINNLLDISKSDSGFLKLNASNHDIVSIVETITLSVVPYVESKGINIIFDTDIEEKIIACDSDKFERAFLNILSNAIKFTDSGGSIFVNATDNNDYISISIRDTGVGIPEENLNSIFDRFMQVDKTLRRNREGTGIGLSIVKSFIDMHNGEIEVKSNLGQGTEFIIKLPCIVLEEEEKDSNLFIGNINAVDTEFSDL